MDWSYVAGFFDGDGCTYLSPGRSPTASLDQKVEESAVLDRIGEFLSTKGIRYSVYIGPQRLGRPESRYQSLRINDRASSRKFFEGVLPFVIVKRKRVLLALEYLDVHPPRNRSTDADYKVAQEHYLLGEPLGTVSRRMHMSEKILRYKMASNGVHIRSLAESHSAKYFPFRKFR